MSKTHKNIVKPQIPFNDLPKIEQEIIRVAASYLVKKMGIDIPGETAVESAIELFEKGLIRIIDDKENRQFLFEIFDFDKGVYVPIRGPSQH
jgi:hypothetical protein